MFAFLQAASVFGVPVAANAGAVKATTRLKARIEANAFMMGLLRLQRPVSNHHKAAPGGSLRATERRDRGALSPHLSWGRLHKARLGIGNRTAPLRPEWRCSQISVPAPPMDATHERAAGCQARRPYRVWPVSSPGADHCARRRHSTISGWPPESYSSWQSSPCSGGFVEVVWGAGSSAWKGSTGAPDSVGVIKA